MKHFISFFTLFNPESSRYCRQRGARGARDRCKRSPLGSTRVTFARTGSRMLVIPPSPSKLTPSPASTHIIILLIKKKKFITSFLNTFFQFLPCVLVLGAFFSMTFFCFKLVFSFCCWSLHFFLLLFPFSSFLFLIFELLFFS